MSLAQLHYTSVTAVGAEPGPRFTAVDKAIPAPVLAEAGPLIGYEPPAGTPQLLPDAGLRSLPASFSFTALSDGSRLLSRTVAVGTGNGRPGPVGFHTHAVHLPPGTRLPGNALPVTAWGAAGWVSATPERAIPDPLTARTTMAPPHGLSREGLNDFAVSRGPWLAAVFADLRRVSEDASAPPVVLVERETADVARWIALAAAVLPRELAEQLTFTTYTRQPRRAPQQVIGVLPQDAPDPDDAGLRVHRATGQRPAAPVDDAWAHTAARIWRSRAPELFRDAAGLPGGAFAAGPLAATALCAGITLGAVERASAADWAAERPYALDEKRTQQLTDALTAPADDRTAAECGAVLRLLTALEGRAPATAVAPLAALLVTEAVRGGDVALEPPARSAFAEPEGERAAARLVAELGEDVLAELTSGSPGSVARTVQLLRIVRLLRVDAAHVLPEAVRGLARALLDEAEAEAEAAGPGAASGSAPTLLGLLDEQFDVRTALLGELDRLAPDEPAATERLLARVTLPFTGTQALPHLRMCAEAPRAKAGGGADRVMVLHTVLRAAGMSAFAEPLVLRTAVGLVWGQSTPTAGEARLLLGETTSDAHRAAGTWACLVDAALGAPADDEAAPELAHDLLRGFPHQIDARVRASLLLLEFARDVRSGAAAPGWTDRARSLREQAEPVEPVVLDHAFGALARRLLAEDRPEAELYAFVHSGDRDLVAAYGRAARHGEVAARLRAEPAFAAACFAVWTAHPHAGDAWNGTRTALLDEVLRPAVRALSSADVLQVEQAVERSGSSRLAEAFRAWHRQDGTTLGKLGRRIAGRIRRS